MRALLSPVLLLLLGLSILSKTIMVVYPSLPIAVLWSGLGVGMCVYLIWLGRSREFLRVSFGCILGGFLLNGVVVLANGGFMPATDRHVGYGVPAFYIPASTARWSFLGDVLGIFSIGDVVVGIGVVVLSVYMINRTRREGSWSWVRACQ